MDVKVMSLQKFHLLESKNNIHATETPYALHAEQLCGKFPLCSNSSSNLSGDLHSFIFIGRLFHKTLPMKLNEFIPYF